MNVPAIAKKSFEKLKEQSEFVAIVNFVLDQLKKLSNKVSRARFIHKLVDEYNEEVFSHPLVKQFSPCKMGCTGCCHTQVSVTEEEAQLLARWVDEIIPIEKDRLRLQAQAGDSSENFYRLSFEQRKCVFLDEKGACKVYEDRPSVCRTNAVLGDASQCDTRSSIRATRLVRTSKSDMVIYASYLFTRSSGALPRMLERFIKPDQ